MANGMSGIRAVRGNIFGLWPMPDGYDLMPVDGDPFSDAAAAETAGNNWLGNVVGNAVSNLWNIPKEALIASERLPSDPQYDPAPIVNAAGLAMTGGIGGVPAEVGEAILGAGPIRAKIAQSDFGSLPPSQDWITQWARQYGAGQRPTRQILDEWARQNNIPLKWDYARSGNSAYAIIGDQSVKTPSGAAGHYVKVRFSDHAPVYNDIGEPNFIDSSTVDANNLIDALNWKFGTNLVGDTPKTIKGDELWPSETAPASMQERATSNFDRQVEYATSVLEQYPELAQRTPSGRVNLMGKKIDGWAFDMAIRNARESGQLGLRLIPVDHDPFH